MNYFILSSSLFNDNDDDIFSLKTYHPPINMEVAYTVESLVDAGKHLLGLASRLSNNRFIFYMASPEDLQDPRLAECMIPIPTTPLKMKFNPPKPQKLYTVDSLYPRLLEFIHEHCTLRSDMRCHAKYLLEVFSQHIGHAIDSRSTFPALMNKLILEGRFGDGTRIQLNKRHTGTGVCYEGICLKTMLSRPVRGVGRPPNQQQLQPTTPSPEPTPPAEAEVLEEQPIAELGVTNSVPYVPTPPIHRFPVIPVAAPAGAYRGPVNIPR